MVLVKVLGGLDLAAALTFLALIFGIDIFPLFLLFVGLLVLLKGMFVFTGDVLSAVDLFAGLILLLAIYFALYPIILWTCALLLLAKGFVSFL